MQLSLSRNIECLESKLVKEKKGRGHFSTVSLPTSLMEEVEKVVAGFKYWSTKTDFIREAVLEKLKEYRKELEAKKRSE